MYDENDSITIDENEPRIVTEYTAPEEMSDELLAKLRKANGATEVASVFEEAGQRVSTEKIMRIAAELDKLAEMEGTNLSMDELEAVTGGAVINLDFANGCSETVEYGSNCWTADGGCTFLAIKYDNPPTPYKCRCGHYTYKDGTITFPQTNETFGKLACPYCHYSTQIELDIYEGL